MSISKETEYMDNNFNCSSKLDANKKSKLIKTKFKCITERILKIQNELNDREKILQLITKLKSYPNRKKNNFIVKKEVNSLIKIQEKEWINSLKQFPLKKEIGLSKKRINSTLAQKIVNALKENNFESIEENILNKIDLNAYKKLRSSILDILTESIKETLYNIVLASRSSESISQVASNAITLLNKSGFSFSNKDLSRIKIPYSDLSCGLFINTNFESSCLYGVNFSMVNIYDSNFRNCNMIDVNFGENLNFDFEEDAEIIKFSPCKRFLAISTESKIFLYDANNYQEITVFSGADWIVSFLLFSDNGNYLASSVLWKETILWDTSNMLQIAKIEKSDSCNFSPCQNYACFYKSSRNKSILKIYSTKINKIINEITWLDPGLKSAYFSSSGQNLIILNDEELSIWSLTRKTKINQITGIDSASLELSFNRKYIVLSDHDTILYSAENLEALIIWKNHQDFIAFSPCGRYLALSDWFIKIYDLWNRKNFIICSQNDALDFSPFSNRKFILYKDIDKKLKTLKIPCEKNKNLLTRYEIKNVSFSQDSKFFAIITITNWIFIFLTKDYKLIKKFSVFQGFWSCRYHFIEWSDSFFGYVCEKDTIKILNIYDESLCKVIKASFFMCRFKFSPDEKKIAICGNSRYVEILDLDSCLVISRLDSYSKTVSKCYWSRCGNFLIAVSFKEEIRIWRVKDMALLYKYDGNNESELLRCISTCKNYLISSVCLEGRRNIKVLYIGDIENNRKRITKAKEIYTDCKLKSVFMSSDTKRIIAGDEVGNILIWDFYTEEIIKKKKVHKGWVNSIDLSLNGNFIMSGGYDGKAKIWKFDKWF